MANKADKETMSSNVKESPEKSGETNAIVAPVPAEAPIVTKESLMAELTAAMASNDWQSVAKIGASIAKYEATIKRQEREKLETEVIEVAELIKIDIESVIESYLDNPILEKCAGVWYSYDFGTGLKAIRLLSPNVSKSSTKATGSAGSVGKKFDVTTDALLSQFGDELYKDSGMTASDFHKSTTDGNKRYILRTWLLKKGGYTS